MRWTAVPLLCLFLLAACHSASKRAAAPPSPAAAEVFTEPPGVVDVAALDRKTDPCEDFYHFACGGFLASVPIPDDRAQWSRSFSEIEKRNDEIMRQILEDLRAGHLTTMTIDKGEPAPYLDKLADYYAACMDEERAETASLPVLMKELQRINAVSDPRSLAGKLAELHLEGVNALFRFESQQDFKDATQVIALMDQGGLGLPDRDYYIKDDDKLKEIRAEYLSHIGRMLALVGVPEKEAQAQARTILQIETALARVSMPLVERRDPYKIYHRMDLKGLKERAPLFPWERYLSALGYPRVQAMNVAVPGFFAGLSALLGRTLQKDLKTYLAWRLIKSAAPALPRAFVEEDFRFESMVLSGAKALLPRWKRCLGAVDQALGEALARIFVARTFSAEDKARALAMIQSIEAAFEENLESLSWMDGPTRAEATAKLKRIVNKIGYPDRFRDYDRLETGRDSYLANLFSARRFEARRQLDKIGRPLDRSEWLMSPPTVNAYYNASLNEMVFPAGILQPPFYDRRAGDVTNYGAIGMVMGHELTHGFDDEGRHFDGQGNLRDFWQKPVADAFNRKAECVVRHYEGYEVMEGRHISGRLTLGENIADIGGIKFAYAAWRRASAGKKAPPVAGFSPEQQFFLSFAQGWCTNRRDELVRRRLIEDPHSPPRFRVNGSLANTPEFQAAFSCREGSPMAPRERCSVW